ncbi:MAG: nucleotide exchange factor GrpE [Actinomycetes bacterium]
MTDAGDQEYEETGVRFTDKRRIDPETGELRPQDQVRQPETPAASPAVPSVEEQVEAAFVEGEITEVESKVAELTADLQRVHAEYANYRRRVDRDRELVKENAVGGALSELLPIVDDVERARQHGELEGAFKTVGEALETALARIGLETFGEAGEAFDPNVHEALTHEASDEVSEPTVTAVYQRGYRYAGRVLRPARVAVADTD